MLKINIPNIPEINNMTKILMYLENTRMLFDFMFELSARYTEWKATKNEQKSANSYLGYNGEGGLKERSIIIDGVKNFVKETVENTKEDGKEGGLYQNPLSPYVQFWKKLYSKYPRIDYQVMSSMLNYFNILQYLTESRFAHKRESREYHSSLPYFFEDICLSVKEMTKCDACYILYNEDGECAELVSRSGFVFKNSRAKRFDVLSSMNIKISELDGIVKAYGRTTHESLEYKITAPDGACVHVSYSCTNKIDCADIGIIKAQSWKSDSANKIVHNFVVVELKLAIGTKNNYSNEKRSFFVVLDNQCPADNPHFIDHEKMLEAALKILFLRNRLLKALENEYAKIIDYRFDCGYIRSVCCNYEPDKKETYTGIMHISDLHLGIQALNRNTIKALSQINLGTHDIDLLAVTGDIVSASASASDAQRKYANAGKMLTQIALNLWGINDKEEIILPHDWKRRVLIIPGNHDYSAMSDVIVETNARQIKAAFPAACAGGTMSKYTYFLEFLVNYLDAPIDELLENDLNDIRYYEKLDLCVGLFNTCSEVNSLQNNKVSLDEAILERLLSKSKWGSKNVIYLVLMHHSPLYEINYVEDRYEYWNYFKTDYEIKLYEKYIKLLKKLADGKQLAPNETKTVTLLERLLAKKQNDEEFSNSSICSDMRVIINYKNSNWNVNEYYANTVSKAKNLIDMQNYDIKKLKEISGQLLNPKDVITLAGHEHCTKMENYLGKKNKPVLLVGKMYEREIDNGRIKSQSINYSIIIVKKIGARKWSAIKKQECRCYDRGSVVCRNNLPNYGAHCTNKWKAHDYRIVENSVEFSV